MTAVWNVLRMLLQMLSFRF